LFAGVLYVLEHHHLIYRYVGMVSLDVDVKGIVSSWNGRPGIVPCDIWTYGAVGILMQPDTVPPLRLWGPGITPGYGGRQSPTLPARFVLS